MEMDAERVRYMGQIERLNHYMGRRNVPMNLRQRVREYMELTWINSGGTDDYEVLAFVSRSLRRELAMHNASKLIAGVPFLQAGSEGFVFRFVCVRVCVHVCACVCVHCVSCTHAVCPVHIVTRVATLKTRR